MDTQVIRENIEILRESLYGSRPLEENTGGGFRKKQSDCNRSGVQHDIAYGRELALPSKGAFKPNAQKAIAAVNSSLAKKENDGIFSGKAISPEDAVNSNTMFLSPAFYTEFVTGQYAIRKVTLDTVNYRISRYRETQAYRQLPEPALEAYV